MTRNQIFGGAARVLTFVDEKRLPQILSITLGSAGGGIGLLMLLLPGGFEEASVFHVLLAVPAVLWGIALVGLGTSLVTVGIMDYSRSYALCGVMSVTLLVYTILVTLGLFQGGEGTGLLPWLTLIVGWLCSVNALAVHAPRLREVMHEQATRPHVPQ